MHPCGIIFGQRAYLVAVADGAQGSTPSNWRIDRMSDVVVLDEGVSRPDDFDLARFARRSFGAFHSAEEYGPVGWRFCPEVADNVRSFRFHPDQVLIEEEDGSITVRFEASGHLEMAWALYAWGDKVQVLEPARLRRMVEGYQRADFPAVP